MSVVPRDVLVCAQKIMDVQNDEAGHRAVISRAYYAAYHAARIFYESLGTPIPAGGAGGVHAQLVSLLLSPPVPSTDPRHLRSRQIGYILRDLHRSRITADYQISELVEIADAVTAMSKGTRAVDMLMPAAPTAPLA